MSMDKWRHKDEWKQGGNGFLVVVSRHTEPPSPYDPDEGVNRWAVYAYIYPKHPHFARFAGNDMWQEAASVLPLHGGPSLFRWHRDDDGKPCSVQVGADYHHLHDDYTHIATPEDAYTVFKDAQELFDWLTLSGEGK